MSSKSHLIVVVLIALCNTLSAGELERLHAELYGPHKLELTPSPRQRVPESKEHGITEIGLERTACFGTCPVYSVVIRSDGRFRYFGEEHVSRKGRHAGRVNEEDFRRLAQFVDDAGYMNLEHSYQRPVTDHPTVFTLVEKSGKRKLVRHYANAGPSKLWALEQLIDKLLLEAEWEAARPSPR